MKLSDYIENNLGLNGFYVNGKCKIFYPSKPRSCNNCEFYKEDIKKCSNGFDTLNGKPKSKCYPVKYNSGAGNIGLYHADVISQKIMNLRNRKY